MTIHEATRKVTESSTKFVFVRVIRRSSSYSVCICGHGEANWGLPLGIG